MQQKVRMAAFVAVLVAVWGAGFLWVRGDFSTPDTAAAQARTRADAGPSPTPPTPITPATIKPTPTPSPSPTPSTSPAVPASPVATPALTAQETKPVDVNPELARPRPRVLPPVADFTMASFNILGSSHTNGKGHSPGLASGVQRMGGVLQLLGQHGVSVVGIQEFQPDQRTAFANRAAGWDLWPGLKLGRRAGENSVAWRTDTWELVETNLIDIPYFHGRIRPMPYVLLKHRETGISAWFSTFHNPADVMGPAQRFRNEATNREIGLFNRLEATGLPQFVTGDMNERQEYPCRVTAGTPLLPAQGGRCPANAPMGIDWIFGSPKVTFSNYVSDKSPLVRRTSDHPIVVTRVSIDALDFPKAYTAPVG